MRPLELRPDAEAHFGQSDVAVLLGERELRTDDPLGDPEFVFLDQRNAQIEEAAGDDPGIAETKRELHLLDGNLPRDVRRVLKVISKG